MTDDGRDVEILTGDCVDILADMDEASVDSVVTDPPYGLEFMGREWDKFGRDTGNGYQEKPRITARGDEGGATGYRGAGGQGINYYTAGAPFQAWCETWARAVLRVLKPGGYLLAFGGTRTYHRMVCAVEDAGFEIRDTIAWLYGSGFPKSLDVSKAIDNAAGAERKVVGAHPSPAGNKPGGAALHMSARGMPTTADLTAPATDDARRWDGYGTALKPAHEPVVVARKPLAGTVAANVLEWGTGALNIDACRIDTGGETWDGNRENAHTDYSGKVLGAFNEQYAKPSHPAGRWPANVVLDEAAADILDQQTGDLPVGGGTGPPGGKTFGGGEMRAEVGHWYGDRGGASRYFYCAKASTVDRGAGNTHPTVKPVELMRWLIRLVTAPGQLVLDPFAGSGTTAVAALIEGRRVVLVEREPEYVDIIRDRLTRPIQPVMF